MTPLRRVAALSAPVLLALSLTACGGGDSDSSGGDAGSGGDASESAPATAADAPTDASEGDFCGVFEDFQGQAEDIGPDDSEAQAALLGDIAGQFKDVGTPEDVPADVRAGFEVVTDAWSDLSASDLQGDAGDQLGLTPEDQETATAFLTYATETCQLDAE